MAPDLSDLVPTLAEGGVALGGIIGFIFQAQTTRALLENVALGAAIGGFVGTLLGFLIGLVAQAAGA